MVKQWLVLLFIGCALASPWPKPKREISDEEARLLRRRTIIENPDSNPADVAIAVNENGDVPNIEYGDIKENPTDASGPDKRSTAHRDVNSIWTSRVIPYTIASGLSSQAVTLINQAIAKFNEKSCLNWQLKTNEQYHVSFQNLKGCWSYIGFTNDERNYQEISIGTGCENIGVIIHEMLHAAGFWHEQSRPDRNTKVEIFWENIVKGQEKNFEKKENSAVDVHASFDEDSVMMYGNYAFSANGKMTLRSLDNPNLTFGQRNGFSPDDIIALNRLYSCNVTDGGWSMYTSFSPCDANCKKHRSRFCTNANKAACDASIPAGIQTETVTCPNAECYAPVNGHWGKWGAWGACNKPCDEGTKTRHRNCSDPAPKNNGANCVGSENGVGVCKLRDCGAGPGECGFDDDAHPLCDWQQDPNDEKVKYKDFLRGSSTPSSGTGPQSGDHTGNGKFIYMEASDCIHTTGKYVRLLSVTFPATGSSGRCMSFWYHTYGAYFKEINLYVKTLSNGVLTKFGTIPASDGGRGNVWHNAKFHFTHTSSEYKIVIESQCGLDFRCDASIDDIHLYDGACPA